MRAHLLPLLTDEKWHSRVRRGYARGDEPVLYVDNVKRYYQLLQWLDDTQPQNAEVLAIDRRRESNILVGAPLATPAGGIGVAASGEETTDAAAEKTL